MLFEGDEDARPAELACPVDQCLSGGASKIGSEYRRSSKSATVPFKRLILRVVLHSVGRWSPTPDPRLFRGALVFTKERFLHLRTAFWVDVVSLSEPA